MLSYTASEEAWEQLFLRSVNLIRGVVEGEVSLGQCRLSCSGIVSVTQLPLYDAA